MNLWSLTFTLFSIGIEMPNYEVIKTLSNNVEIRRYDASKWACATTKCSAEQCSKSYQSKMFRKLFKYISGENDLSQKIPMTAPVTMTFKSVSDSKIGPDSEVSYEMGFFVPKDFNAKTPNPTGENMYVKSESELIVAVSRFSGYAKFNDSLTHRDLIIESLGSDATNYDTRNFIAAGYDAPFKPFNRRNEVWLRKIN